MDRSVGTRTLDGPGIANGNILHNGDVAACLEVAFFGTTKVNSRSYLYQDLKWTVVLVPRD